MQYALRRPSFYISTGFLLFLILAELVAILQLNNGFLVYTLDDAYIHLAMAENLMQGHYGVNLNEFSAPSSSILWPFIIAPFSYTQASVFYLNIAVALITVFIFAKFLYASLDLNDQRKQEIVVSGFLILLILATNLTGLVFTGMEHVLQLLLVSIIGYGLIVKIETDKIRLWFLLAIVAAPLIRYENLAVSIAAIFFLFLNKQIKPSAIVLISLIAAVAAFSLFLSHLGLDPFPASVISKSAIVEQGGALDAFLYNLQNNLYHRLGTIMAVGCLGLTAVCLHENTKIEKKRLAAITILAVAMHFLAGQFGWYRRYEIYIWAFFLLQTIYITGNALKAFLQIKAGRRKVIKILTLAGGFVAIVNSNYIYGLTTIPIASNNIYEQHYQMHRFTVDYYKKPVAVNDLGYVSYKNSKYVLDLWGLASTKAQRYRKNRQSPEWMKELAQANGVELVMIYKDWFKTIPQKWIKIGELHLGKKRITPKSDSVTFYATNSRAKAEIVKKLKRFTKTLPAGTTFILQERES